MVIAGYSWGAGLGAAAAGSLATRTTFSGCSAWACAMASAPVISSPTAWSPNGWVTTSFMVASDEQGDGVERRDAVLVRLQDRLEQHRLRRGQGDDFVPLAEVEQVPAEQAGQRRPVAGHGPLVDHPGRGAVRQGEEFQRRERGSDQLSGR